MAQMQKEEENVYIKTNMFKSRQTKQNKKKNGKMRRRKERRRNMIGGRERDGK
jgi:hypothetical protein